MRSSASRARPFDEGATSVKLQTGLPNPYASESVEFKNFELGRAYALRSRPVAIARNAEPVRRALAKGQR